MSTADPSLRNLERMLARDVIKPNPALDEETLEMEHAVPDGDETGKARPADGQEDTVSLSAEAEATASADDTDDDDDHDDEGHR